jgi:peroxin-16
MAAKRRSDALRWRVVVLLESAKALCRLLLMRLTDSRPPVSPPLPEREPDPRGREPAAEPWDEAAAGGEEPGWPMPRTGLALPALPDSRDITEYLLKHVLSADDVKAPRLLLHRLTTLRGQLAEVLWILRPVVYALVLQRLRRRAGGDDGKAGWTPWVLGLGMEVLARQLARKDFADRVPGGGRGLTGLEREELRKRGWGQAWWLLRGAFYENVTR